MCHDCRHVPENLQDQIIADRHVLEGALTLEMRKLIADVAKQEWELLGLSGFVLAVRNFTHGEHIMFFRGASTIPGIIPTMQGDERQHREDRRIVPASASHFTVLTRSVPALLSHRAFKNRSTHYFYGAAAAAPREGLFAPCQGDDLPTLSPS